ncbi:TPA: orotate phosphoribosyltransferase [Candidatus Daviesbacteria bacterium]|nr:MAG: orotate phosphoribosyltransferase [Candidatus Daviesbacteria bacterium RIFCSPLOWO2_12_FULL_38_10]HBQ50730.1 orotate phosphoribosyltransferase [Candidatus Daviesbacteria bacterium]
MSIAEQVAKMLLEIKAVTLSPQTPYKFVSGMYSPIYTDNRLLMGYPVKRKEITGYMANLMKEKMLAPEIIAGTSTAGIPPAAWLAELLELPMVYVRGNLKDHGKGKQVEGVMRKGAKVLLIEDLITTGKSSLAAVDAIRTEGGMVDTCLAFLDYGFKEAKEKYQEKDVILYTLTSFEELVNMAVEMNLLKGNEKEMVLDWQKDPWAWTEKVKLTQKGQSVDY